MESSVRYIQLPGAGQKPALCFRGSKFAYAIINEGGKVRSLEVDLKDYDKSVHVKSTKNGGEDYSPVAFREAVLRIIQKAGSSVTTRAQTLLDKGAYLKPDDLLPEEEPMLTPKNEEDDETIEIRENEEGDVEIDGKTHKDTVKPKVRKLPKRVTREGKAEDPPARKAAETAGPRRLNGSAGTPRPGDRDRKPAALLPIPSKGSGASKETGKAKALRGGSGKTLVAILASEAGIAQQPCRVKLRSAGLRAPYDEKNEAACRKALGLPLKKGK